MNERDELEQHRQAAMTNEKQLSKSDSRLKSRFRSFRKASNSTAVERARSFFRSFDPKRHQDHRRSPSASSGQELTVRDSIHLSTTSGDSQLNSVGRLTNISISKSTKVEKTNPRDMIVYRVAHDEEPLPLNYFRQKYRQYMKPSLLFPKQYYQELLNKSARHCSTSFDNRGSCLRRSLPTFHANPARIYPPSYNPASHVNRPTESFCLAPPSPIVRPLPVPAAHWEECVDRLNAEYRSTIDALQQTKEYLDEVYLHPISPVTKCASIIARRVNQLTNGETKKTANVTFRLPSEPHIERSRIPSPKAFGKPKLVKPIELNSFSDLEPISAMDDSDDKLDSISSIIKKFNDLSNSISATLEKCQTSEKTVPSKSIVTNPNDQIENQPPEEETIYTIETFCQPAEHKPNPSSPLNSTADESPKGTHNFISRIPKRNTSTMHGAPLKPAPKPAFASCKFHPTCDDTHRTPIANIAGSTDNSTSAIRKNYVKSIVRQLNTNISASSSSSSSTVPLPMCNKRPFFRTPLGTTTFTKPNAV